MKDRRFNLNYKRKFPLVVASIALSSFISTIPVQAKDLYKKAVSLYETGAHDRAKRYFHHIIKHKPDHWQSHYYLATIHLKNNDLVLARKYYNSCVVNYPDIPTCKNIVKGLAIIDQKENLAQSRPATIATEATEIKIDKTTGKTPSDIEKKKLALLEKIKAEELARHNTHKRIVENRKREILEDAEKRAQEVIAQGERQIKNLYDNGHWFVKNSRTGEVKRGVPTVVVNEIRGNAQTEASRIRDIAYTRAKGIKTPAEPRLTNSVAHQLTAPPTKSGTSLHHVGTNLYVRNYIHKSPEETKSKKKIAETPGRQAL